MQDKSANESSISQLTRKNTLDFAASIIANWEFPKKEHIPNTVPKPFTNFGHQPLIDHELLQFILWDTIGKIKKIVEPWKKSHRLLIFYNITLASLIFGSLLYFESADMFISFVAAGLSLWLGSLVISSNKEKHINKIADIKASVLEDILHDTYEGHKSHKEIIHERMKYFGNGVLDQNNIPILTITKDNVPFPGFGRLQIENTLVCKVKKDAGDIDQSEFKLNQMVFDNITKDIEKSVNADIYSGVVVTLYGNSIGIDSIWLDEKKKPKLWLSKKDLNKLVEMEDASTRVYQAIHVVFPNYNTSFTFFFRIFFADDAISSHIAVSTIGPPILSKPYIQKALLQYRLQKEERNKNNFNLKFFNIFSFKKEHELVSQINEIKIITKNLGSFINLRMDLSKILKLDIKKQEMTYEDNVEFEKKYNQVVNQNTMWPGIIGITNEDFRDMNSYAFTNDFYGKPEMLASLKVIYEKISYSLLDSFDSLGFDASEYRDKDGNYIINADKIDNLIIGEKIHIDKNKSSKKSDKEKRIQTKI